MIHRANANFWECYQALPLEIKHAADKQFALLKSHPDHGSLRFKKIGIRLSKEVWSARVTLKYRALGFKDDNECVWFWIGEHGVYNLLIKR